MEWFHALRARQQGTRVLTVSHAAGWSARFSDFHVNSRFPFYLILTSEVLVNHLLYVSCWITAEWISVESGSSVSFLLLSVSATKGIDSILFKTSVFVVKEMTLKFISKFCTAAVWKSCALKEILKRFSAHDDLAILNYTELILSFKNVTEQD